MREQFRGRSALATGSLGASSGESNGGKDMDFVFRIKTSIIVLCIASVVLVVFYIRFSILLTFIDTKNSYNPSPNMTSSVSSDLQEFPDCINRWTRNIKNDCNDFIPRGKEWNSVGKHDVVASSGCCIPLYFLGSLTETYCKAAYLGWMLSLTERSGGRKDGVCVASHTVKYWSWRFFHFHQRHTNIYN